MGITVKTQVEDVSTQHATHPQDVSSEKMLQENTSTNNV